MKPMPNMVDVEVTCHNLTIRGASYTKGARLALDLTLPSSRMLLHDGLVEVITAPTKKAVIDNTAEIKHNNAKHSKDKAVKHGKRNSKSRRVRDTGAPVPEGLPGAKSSD